MPQMGAMVEVLSSAVHTFRLFTDENGFYSASGLLPGVYSVKAYSTSFLPALREHVADAEELGCAPADFVPAHQGFSLRGPHTKSTLLSRALDGSELACKLQYPDMQSAVEADLGRPATPESFDE